MVWYGSRAPSRWRQRGLGTKPPSLGNFCNFSIKMTHFYAYLMVKYSYFKAITHQLKAFEKQFERTK